MNTLDFLEELHTYADNTEKSSYTDFPLNSATYHFP